MEGNGREILEWSVSQHETVDTLTNSANKRKYPCDDAISNEYSGEVLLDPMRQSIDPSLFALIQIEKDEDVNV
jgi:hypothetical protein